MPIFRRRTRVSAPPSVADALFTQVQQRVLGALFAHPKRRFSLSELTALSGTGSRAIRRELKRLKNAGLVIARLTSGEEFYQANGDAPAFEEIRALVVKTFGVADVLRVALATEGQRIRAAFLFRKDPRTLEALRDDVDVFVLSESLTYADLSAVLENAAAILGRRINPTLYSPRELARRLRDRNPAVVKLLSTPRIWLLGTRRFSP